LESSVGSRSLIELQLSAPMRGRVGEAVAVEVALRNASSRPVWILGVVPGAEGGARPPNYLPRVIAEGRVVAAPGAARVVPGVPLRSRDFHRLEPGETIDPTGGGLGHGWVPLQTFAGFRPRHRGRHVFVLTLSTEPDARDRWPRELELADDRDALLARLGAMPRVVVESNRLEVTVV
jgi:hypothetical protein